MRFAMVSFLLVAALSAALLLWIRLAPTDPATWHVDPLIAPDPPRPNFARIDRLLPQPPTLVAARLATAAAADNAVRIAGDDTHATWQVRSRLMRYPDFISLRLIPEGSGTRVVAFSRSRFGYGDQGVNAARLARWFPR